jgi:hypothetical protein
MMFKDHSFRAPLDSECLPTALAGAIVTPKMYADGDSQSQAMT